MRNSASPGILLLSMRVVEPHEFKGVIRPKKNRSRKVGSVFLLFLVLTGYLTFAVIRPLPLVSGSTITLQSLPKQQVAIDWPGYGQAAVGVVGYGVLATDGEQKPLPTASVAKVITALAVLKKQPLTLGEQGPLITYDRDDVEELDRVIAQNGSHNLVAAGAQISQYQALQALLLPSSNNMAYTISKWAFGSEEEYVIFANNFVRSLGMNDTMIADASGFSPKTVSTANDLARLAVNAMDNPVIAEIVGQTGATIPVAGQIHNVNDMLGRQGLIGIKTGNTDEAGGCFMAAVARTIDGERIVAVSVIMAAPTRSQALQDSAPLANSVLDGFEKSTIVTKGQSLGKVQVPWAGNVELLAKDDVAGLRWRGEELVPVQKLDLAGQYVTTGGSVGSIEATFGRDRSKTELVVSSDVSSPSLLWRLTPRL